MIWAFSRPGSEKCSPGRSMEDAIRAAAPGDELVVGFGDKATSDYLGGSDEGAVLLVHGDDDQEHAVLGQRLAVAQDDVTDLADRDAVDVDTTGLDPDLLDARCHQRGTRWAGRSRG